MRLRLRLLFANIVALSGWVLRLQMQYRMMIAVAQSVAVGLLRMKERKQKAD